MQPSRDIRKSAAVPKPDRTTAIAPAPTESAPAQSRFACDFSRLPLHAHSLLGTAERAADIRAAAVGGAFNAAAAQLGIPADQVQVRSDTGAVDFLQKNQAVAATLNASTILVQPERRTDAAVMAHELVHVAQLRRGGRGSVERAERSADAAARAVQRGRAPGDIGLAAAPPLFLKLSGGAFGQALDNAGPSEAVIKLLWKSKAFMTIVDALDKGYVWLHDPKYTATGSPLAGGKVTSGPFAGRRVLYIQRGAEQGSFLPFGSPDTLIAADLIKVNVGKGDAESVRSIAHEATHAFHAITGTRPPADIEAAIAAGVTEEIDTRTSEVAIVQEIYPKKSPVRALVDRDVARGYLNRPLVERDIAPDIGLTYLESSAFSVLLAEAQRKDGISDERAAEIRESIDKGPKKFPMTRGKHGYDEPSKYAFVYVNRKIALATWQKFKHDFQGDESSLEAKRAKERLLEENARALLDGRIHYTALPKS